MKEKVILDTDIGGDPDDAFALLFALNSPELEVELVVTTDEHRAHRAAFAKMLLEALGENIEVVSGSDLGNTKCCLIDEVVEGNNFEIDYDYLQAIGKVVKRNKTTHYVSIGPESNLASFLEHRPELVSKINAVIMGGAVSYDEEHNARYDPKSALKVFNSDLKKRYVVRDVTFNKRIEINESHPIFNRMKSADSVASNLLLKNCQNFFKRLHPSTYMHDSLTLSSIIDERIVKFEKKDVLIEKWGRFVPDRNGRNTIISEYANYVEFMKLFSDRLPF